MKKKQPEKFQSTLTKTEILQTVEQQKTNWLDTGYAGKILPEAFLLSYYGDTVNFWNTHFFATIEESEEGATITGSFGLSKAATIAGYLWKIIAVLSLIIVIGLYTWTTLQNENKITLLPVIVLCISVIGIFYIEQSNKAKGKESKQPLLDFLQEELGVKF